MTPLLSKISDNLETQLLTINQLSKILTNNTAHKFCNDPPQIDLLGEDAISSAINLISTMAHNDLCELLNSLEAPHE